MSRFIAVDRDTAYLLPPSVDEWLPQNHLARFVVEIIDQLDLSELTRQYAGRGSDAYHPAMLLGLLVYGYATGLHSSRKIERACHDSVAMRFIAANTQPDHDSIATFRRRFLPQIEALFVQVLMLAREMKCLVCQGVRRRYQCIACGQQTSLTAGSLMDNTKLPLTIWFLAIYLISQAKTGISSLALMRHLGVSYPTAWLPHQKINRAMTAQEATHRLEGTVQVDDAYLGGELPGGKAGRGSENKVPFVAAVSLSSDGRPLHLKLALVSGFTSEAVGKWAKASLAPGACVMSDGLGRFAAVTDAVTDAGCIHMPTVVGARKPRDLPQFKWINTVLGNLKTTLAGTFHALKFSKYGADYLGAFAYRFNRRFDLRGLVARSIVDVARCSPITRETVRTGHAETCFSPGT